MAALRLVRVEAGEYLVTQSDRLTHLFFLVQGKLQVENYDVNGMHIVFSFETDFSVIGDLELFSRGAAGGVQHRSGSYGRADLHAAY